MLYRGSKFPVRFQIRHDFFLHLIKKKSKYVMLCVIWYHLYNFKNVKNTHGGVLLSTIETLEKGVKYVQS